MLFTRYFGFLQAHGRMAFPHPLETQCGQVTSPKKREQKWHMPLQPEVWNATVRSAMLSFPLPTRQVTFEMAAAPSVWVLEWGQSGAGPPAPAWCPRPESEQKLCCFEISGLFTILHHNPSDLTMCQSYLRMYVWALSHDAKSTPSCVLSLRSVIASDRDLRFNLPPLSARRLELEDPWEIF